MDKDIRIFDSRIEHLVDATYTSAVSFTTGVVGGLASIASSTHGALAGNNGEIFMGLVYAATAYVVSCHYNKKREEHYQLLERKQREHQIANLMSKKTAEIFNLSW